jgi:hypothetical protein
VFRRRRRSSVVSAYRRNGGRSKLILFGILAVVVLGVTIFLVQVADGVKPDRQEIRVELPHALGN